MDRALFKHLWRSKEVRSALMKEVARLLIFVLLYIGGVALSRYLREKPMAEGLAGAAFGALGIAVAWGISAIRTVRAVLREHSLLD